jgi:hypothetical protein
MEEISTHGEKAAAMNLNSALIKAGVDIGRVTDIVREAKRNARRAHR